ncbi:ABC transporter ATP-binding protein [Sphingomonas sp. NSE70-1]|uniref:ABC transporter ATP-binding protein n=1 Tax=Sphingomonas caseinilyticus TaxID=2908205 RepID=A0ABT0RR49_9SPHN|nr:ABC transporter ATP-binding protein [Sphingomonas caseinilyticus]MCL6697474.1 ABC transporter ATP-binding protein [Sphingomonas caseinilyticus]
MTLLSARDLAIHNRLHPTALDVQAGELVALIGPNGGGKTSLLRALARIEGASGVVAVDGEDIDEAPMARRRQLLSFLPASRDVTWPISARDVIRLGLDRDDEKRIEEMVSLFELGRLADRPVNQLSTGERARVLAARALVGNPKLLLLDEPLSNLDPYWVLHFLEIFEAAAEAGHMVLAALHDLSQLDRFSRALLIADGRIQMDETPAKLVASERFEEIFRISSANGRWAIRKPADPRSLP